MKNSTPSRQQFRNSLVFLLLTMITSSFLHSALAQTSSPQEILVKGKISTNDGPMEHASIVLKGTSFGTVSNSKGEFTFPKALKQGDILVVSVLGYQEQTFEIDQNTNYINVMLTEEAVEIIGALRTNKD